MPLVILQESLVHLVINDEISPLASSFKLKAAADLLIFSLHPVQLN